MLKSYILLFFLLFGGFSLVGWAQSSKTVNQNVWISYTGLLPINKKLSIHTELSWRRNEYLKNPQQLLLRTALVRNFAKGVSLAGGYSYIITYPYGAFASKSTFPENRIWEQLQVKKQWGKTEVISRLRLEQRFVYQPVLVGTSYKPGPSVYSTRIRIMQRFSIPLFTPSIKDKAIYAAVFDELFYGFGRQIGSHHFDQNRFFGGLGYVVPKFGRVEVGYLHQQIHRSGGTKIENNRTIQINFLPTLLTNRK